MPKQTVKQAGDYAVMTTEFGDPSLAEFLLTRLDEHENDVKRRGTYAVGHAERCIFEGGYEGTASCDCGAVERELIDCASRREVVRCLSTARPSRAGLRGRLEAPAVEDTWTMAQLGTLSYLAMPYADHPDYQDEWKMWLP